LDGDGIAGGGLNRPDERADGESEVAAAGGVADIAVEGEAGFGNAGEGLGECASEDQGDGCECCQGPLMVNCQGVFIDRMRMGVGVFKVS
jgi:hypothetical protein